MFAEERYREIRQIVREKRRVAFADLQRKVKVSAATLRRDLAELERAGEVIRVHGGVLDPGYVRTEISFDDRVLRNAAEKRALAARAAGLPEPGMSVFVDAGTTCLEAGRILLGRSDIRVVTHSVALLAEAQHCAADVLCIGGELRKISGALVGGNTLNALGSIKVDMALIGATGLDADGAYTTELSEAEIKRTIIARSARTVLLCDSSKWGRASTVHFAQWKNFDLWITDRALASAASKGIRAQGVTIRHGL
jgi:DeoR family fructose operon transcriptional repressor